MYELWAHGATYEELHAMNRELRLWEPFRASGRSIRADVRAIQHTFPLNRVKDVLDTFSYMGFEKFDLNNPDETLYICEECE